MRFSKSRLKNYPKYTIIGIKKCFKRAVSRKTSVFIYIYLMIRKDNKKFKFYIRTHVIFKLIHIRVVKMLSEQRLSQQSGNARICRQTRKQTTFVLNFMSKPYQRERLTSINLNVKRAIKKLTRCRDLKRAEQRGKSRGLSAKRAKRA